MSPIRSRGGRLLRPAAVAVWALLALNAESLGVTRTVWPGPHDGYLNGRIEGRIVSVVDDEEDKAKGVATVVRTFPSLIETPEGFEFDPERFRNPYERLNLQAIEAQPENTSGSAINISRRGDHVVGQIDSGFFTPNHAFLWSESGGLMDLGTLDPTITELTSVARDVSDDGTVVVGSSQFNAELITHAFRWTESSGMVDLGSGSGATGFSAAWGVSSDGNLIVGESEFSTDSGSSLRHAFRWTEADGILSLGSLLGPASGRSLASAVTGDGMVVIGDSTAPGGQHAFRWSEATGMVDLGTLPGHRESAAMGVSDDGSIVVGISSPSDIDRAGRFGFPRFDRSSSRAFYWTAETGMQDLTQLLVEAGDTTGTELVAAMGISPDGTWISGITTVPNPEFPDLFVDDIPLLASLTVAVEALPADFNGDGSVNFPDFLLFADVFGQAVPPADAIYDLDGSGTVDFPDFLQFADAFGRTTAVATVPEPAGQPGMIVLLTMLMGVRRRTRPRG